MISRRNILRSLGLAPLFGIPSFLEINEEKDKIEEQNVIIYKDFELRWSGYYSQYDRDKFTGFWTANHKEKPEVNFYSCTGGIATDYLLGSIFDTNVLATHKFLTLRSPKKDFIEMKELALRTLEQVIDNYYKPNAEKKPEYTFGFSGFKQ